MSIKTVGVTLKIGIVVNVECKGDEPTKEEIANAANAMERDGGIELGPFEASDILNYSVEEDDDAE